MTNILLTRRDLTRLLGVSAAAIPFGTVQAQTTQNTLVIGIDIADSISFDPARLVAYTPPLTVAACYETLVTLDPGDYINPKPALASKWERTPSGNGWRFTLFPGIRFASGAMMTAEDVKFSFERLINIHDQPQAYFQSVDRVEIVDPHTIDLIMNDPKAPILTTLSYPGASVVERAVVQQHGGLATTDAKEADKATPWLNGNSAGTGPYRLIRWDRDSQIVLQRNPNYWRNRPAFERVIIRHMKDSAAQLLAVRRGDVAAAFNLIPEQIASLHDSNIRIQRLQSLDFVYVAVTQNPAANPVLATKEARHAIAYAIDYDGIITNLCGGAATRPAHFLPIGVNGSTEQVAKEIAFHQDLDQSRKALQAAGVPDGFEFELNYGNAVVAGVSYEILGEKLQSDLSRVGIRVKLNPLDPVNMRTTYTLGKMRGAVLTWWNPPAVSNDLWASAVVERVAKRVGWNVPPAMTALVKQAAQEEDLAAAAKLWVEWQRQVVDQANLLVLFQPIYQIAVRNTLKDFPLTAAGWQLNIGKVTPA